VGDATGFTNRASRSRLGRLASSSASVGTTTILQCPGSPRSQPSTLQKIWSSLSVFDRVLA
jgi:hypothetical protein